MKENIIPKSRMPERFVLESDDLKMVFKSVRKHWDRSELSAGQNAIYTSAMVTICTTIDLPFVSIVTLKNIWFSVLEALRQLETLNGLKISIDDATEEKKEMFQNLFDIQYKKIESGVAFGN